MQLFKTISGICSKNNGEGHVKKVSNFRSAIQVSYVVVRQWLEILINGFLIKKVVSGWWWMVVDIFWLVVGGGGYILAGDGWWWIYFGWWWVVVDGGGWWHSLVWPTIFLNLMMSYKIFELYYVRESRFRIKWDIKSIKPATYCFDTNVFVWTDLNWILAAARLYRIMIKDYSLKKFNYKLLTITWELYSI